MKRVWTLVALVIGGTIAMTHASMDAGSGGLNVASRVQPTHARPQAKAEDGSGADAIKPFRIHFPDEALADLNSRITAARWPDKETD